MPIRLVLVGAGHAHLALIAQADRLRAADVTPVLIAPSRFDYSGLASGVLSGALEPREAAIDVAALAEAHGVEHRIAEVVAIDREARRVICDDGAIHAYDRVSLNIGSVVRDPDDLTAADDVWPVKPLAGLFNLRTRLETAMARAAPPCDIVIAGGGQTGFEIAAAILSLHQRRGHDARVTLVGDGSGAGFAPPGAARRLERSLHERGLKRLSDRVTGRLSGACLLASSRTIPCDLLVLATGLEAPRLTATASLPLDKQGRIRVLPNLASIGDPCVFAVGDCAVVEGQTRPFAGVFGVRAAPVLLDNLCATATGRSLRSYVPQDRWLSIMDLGDGTGLAMRGRLWWFGRSALALKRRLDHGFVARSRV